MLSGVVDFPMNDWATFYAGGGAGIAMSEYTGSGILSQFPGVHAEELAADLDGRRWRAREAV